MNRTAKKITVKNFDENDLETYEVVLTLKNPIHYNDRDRASILQMKADTVELLKRNNSYPKGKAVITVGSANSTSFIV